MKACGVCHTELDEIEGRLTPPTLPVVPGHQVVGVVEALGQGVTLHKLGDRVGVAWIFSACRSCAFCKKGLENLCPEAKFTGLDKDGGYAEFLVVPERFAYLIPECFDDRSCARASSATGRSNSPTLKTAAFWGFLGSERLRTSFFLWPSINSQTSRYSCSQGLLKPSTKSWPGP